MGGTVLLWAQVGSVAAAKVDQRMTPDETFLTDAEVERLAGSPRRAVNRFELQYEGQAAGRSLRLRRARQRLCVLPLDQLRGLPEADDNARRPGVYFLWIGPTLQYIGQSQDVSTRVARHGSYMGTKQFDRATWMPVAPESTCWYESDHVQHYRPPQNLTRHG